MCVIKQLTSQPHQVLAVSCTHLTDYPSCSAVPSPGHPPTQQVSHLSALSSRRTQEGLPCHTSIHCRPPILVINNTHSCHQFHIVYTCHYFRGRLAPAPCSLFSFMIISLFLTSWPLHLLFPLLGERSRFSYDSFFPLSHPMAFTATGDYNICLLVCYLR